MVEFVHVEFLYLLLFLFPLVYFLKKDATSYERFFSKEILEKLEFGKSGFSKRVRDILLIASSFFIIIALSRPIIDNGEIKVKSSFIDVVVGMDISNSMFANDIYPNRFEFAKRKFEELLGYLKNARVGILGFSQRAFLVAPLSEDYNSLEFLVKNMDASNTSLKGTSFMSALEAANDLYKEKNKKAFLIFTDGGDKKDFSKEIAYAKEHNIAVFVYAIGTKKGGVIKTERGVLKDKRGNIVVVKLNDAIKELALKTGGAYMENSLSSKDMKILADSIREKFKAKVTKESSIRDKKELFYFPLILAIILFFMASFSLPTRSRK